MHLSSTFIRAFGRKRLSKREVSFREVLSITAFAIPIPIKCISQVVSKS